MLYFLVHDAAFFHDALTPALAASWRRRDLTPLAALAAELAPTFDAFAKRFRLIADEQPLVSRAGGLPFDRRVWRHLAGELLLYAAADVPEVPDSYETLARLVGPDESIRHAHAGSRDLAFGAAYRPGRAGLNDEADVARIADALRGTDPASWAAEGLRELTDDDAERAELLEDARDAFARLRELYEDAQARNRVVVCEDV